MIKHAERLETIRPYVKQNPYEVDARNQAQEILD